MWWGDGREREAEWLVRYEERLSWSQESGEEQSDIKSCAASESMVMPGCAAAEGHV